jgi:P-type Cu+ transporter
VIANLRGQGLRVGLITGDRKAIAEEVGATLGIEPDLVYAEVKPEEKAAVLQQWQERGERVAFVGDGINDGPALAQADLGIAVVGASDLAQESADILLLRRDIEAVPEVLDLARATLRTIRQNFVWALVYNAAAVPLAMIGAVTPILCAAAMGLSDLCLLFNSLRLYFWRHKVKRRL